MFDKKGPVRDPTLQKKAYRVLAMLHETQAEFMANFSQA